MAALLSLAGIGKTYPGPQGPVAALSGADVVVGAGGFVALCGPSGCGKSTLLLVAGGLLAPDAGRVTVAGTDVYGLSPGRRAAWRATTVGFVFQQFHLVPYLSVLDNVRAASLGGGTADADRRAGELIERFGLASRRHHVPAALSTGERQRVALARALLNRPAVLLADEPAGNLDAGNAGVVLAALREFAAGGGAVLLVTHDPKAAAAADRTLTMSEGRICGGTGAGAGATVPAS